MKLDEYQQLALRTAPEHQTVHDDLMHAAMGVCTEGGELLDLSKKHTFYGKPVDWHNAAEEIGDVLWYCALAARALGLPLEQIAKLNIDKLKARYPGKFDADKAINRNVEGERTIIETLSVGTGINHPV